MKVLLVENHFVDAKLIRNIFEREGHEIVLARSAEEALRVVAEVAPDVILTDLDLPEMDGVTMTQLLRRQPRTETIPVVAVTAYPDQFPHGPESRDCFAAYVVKPIDTRSLTRTVAAACGKLG